MIALKCAKCGGDLEAAEDQVANLGGTVIIRARNELVCKFCGSKFLAGQELQTGGSQTTVFNQQEQTVHGDQINVGNISGANAVAIGNNSVAVGAGGVAVRGNVSGSVIVTGRNVSVRGDMVGGDKTIIITD